RQGPALILIALFLVRGARGRRGDAAAAMAALPAAALLLLYVPFVQSQNVVYRFQFSPLAVLLTLTAIRVGSCAERREFGAAFLGAAALVGATAWSTMSAIPVPEPRTETILLGRWLRSLRDQGLSLATTEAGRLPYYSGWRTLDSYGLNDPVVATTGLTREYWLEYRPDVVLIHPTSSWDPYREAVPQERSGH